MGSHSRSRTVLIAALFSGAAWATVTAGSLEGGDHGTPPPHVAPGFDAAQETDSAAVSRVIESFHSALARGDSTAALALLTEDVTILESGGVETREQYRSGHLSGDIDYARALPRQLGALKVTVNGNVAWASSTSTVQGNYNGRAVNSVTAELVVLVRNAGTWKISAIHWSSRARRT